MEQLLSVVVEITDTKMSFIDEWILGRICKQIGYSKDRTCQMDIITLLGKEYIDYLLMIIYDNIEMTDFWNYETSVTKQDLYKIVAIQLSNARIGDVKCFDEVRLIEEDEELSQIRVKESLQFRELFIKEKVYVKRFSEKIREIVV